eukprot:354633-Chlamydomonas_euryale.AAC.17
MPCCSRLGCAFGLQCKPCTASAGIAPAFTCMLHPHFIFAGRASPTHFDRRPGLSRTRLPAT